MSAPVPRTSDPRAMMLFGTADCLRDGQFAGARRDLESLERDVSLDSSDRALVKKAIAMLDTGDGGKELSMEIRAFARRLAHPKRAKVKEACTEEKEPRIAGSIAPAPSIESLMLTEARDAEQVVAGFSERIVRSGAYWWRNDGTRWLRGDDAELAVDRAILANALKYYAAAAEEPDSGRRKQLVAHAAKGETARHVRAVRELAKSVPGATIDRHLFDADMQLLNVLNGTIDLRTRSLRPHNAKDYITKRSEIVFDPKATCPKFLRFLEDVFDRNTDMIAFVQRLMGYLLTAETREQVLIFFYGSGANGKGTLVKVLEWLLGEYGTNADVSTFLQRRYDGGPRNDLARLEGVRMVTCTEVPDGKRLDESLVKSVTGEDLITARMLYQENITFPPRFKLLMSGNHRPIIKGVDQGIWRRIRQVPFNVEFEGDRRDDHLREKLALELPGILNFALLGTQYWLENGLMPPKGVLDATAEYRASSDTFRQFLRETCDVGNELSAPLAALYDGYREWTDRANEHAMSRLKFGQALTDRGFGKEERGHDKTIFRTGIAPHAR